MSGGCTCGLPSTMAHVCSGMPPSRWLVNDTSAEAADRDRFQRTLTDRIETFDEAELLRALTHLAHDPAAMDAVNDALDAVVRGDA